jgi:1-acyl-sn-glycerol-3-phosphate acyltransferase
MYKVYKLNFMLLYLRTWAFCLGVISWLIISLAVIPIVFWRLDWSMRYGRFCFVVFKFYLEIFCNIKLKIEGEENMPRNENFIVACKHTSTWETFFFAWYLHLPVYIVKKSLFHIPVFGWYMKRTGMVGINRKGGSSTVEQITKAAYDVIKVQKRNVIIFPQGTRVPIDETYNLQRYPYKRGITAICASLPDVKVLPITHNGAKYFGRGFFSIKRPGIIRIIFLPVIVTAGKSQTELLLEIQETIETETNKIL